MLAPDALNRPAPDSFQAQTQGRRARQPVIARTVRGCITPEPASPRPVPTGARTSTAMTVRTGSTAALISTGALIGAGLS